MTERAAIAVVGAGPVGCLLAILLSRRGFAVTLFERRPDMRLVTLPAGRSINLALANRGISALEAAGLMGTVRSHLIPMRGRMVHHEPGGQQLQPYGNKPHEVIYSVSRNALNSLLLSAAEEAGAVIRFNRRCDGVDLARNIITLVDEETGARETVSFDVAVGTDGAASIVRAAIVGATRGTVEEDPLGHGYKELCIPHGPDGAFRMEKNALHIWPRGGFMLIALPNIDGSFTATLFLPTEGPESFAALRSEAAVDNFFARNFPDAVALLDDVAAVFLRNPIGRLGTIRCRPWHHRGNAVILGDAAHAIVPFHGQGMNAGFEDCIVLDGCIAAQPGDWARAFAAFDAARKPDAEAIADMALENYIEMRDAVRDPVFLLRKELAWKLEALYPDIFIPRYSMVMFHLLPYAEAYRRGKIQAGILAELTRAARNLDDIDMDHARRLIEQRLIT